MVIYYLFWDWEAYQNLQNQNYLAGVIANVMNANMLYPIQLDNQEKSWFKIIIRQPTNTCNFIVLICDS